jgi:hypothetical protein
VAVPGLGCETSLHFSPASCCGRGGVSAEDVIDT